jgi:nucleotide sugar dehydrogenase
MMNERLKAILIKKETSIRGAMEAIDNAVKSKAPMGMALVVDDGSRLIGLVTDGDIRRATLKGISIDRPVSEIMTKDPITVSSGMSSGSMLTEIIAKVKKTARLRDYKVDKVIIVDDKNRVDDVINFFELWRKNEIKTREVHVIGLGYVGLTLAIALVEAGFRVIGVDRDKKVVADLLAGKPHFHEVGLEPLLKYHLNKSLTISSKIEAGDVYIICVGTPIDEKKEPVMEYILDASKSVGRVLKKDDLVILRSTVPVGTCRKTVAPILEKESGLSAGKDFFIAFAPERTAEGKALEELRKLPQVIGGLDENSFELAAKLFREMSPTIINVGSLESAEMVKLINNTFRDLIFAYSNEIALTCDKLGLDALKLIDSANEGYPRGGIPVPSPGVGGICLKKDPYLFINVAEKAGHSPKFSKIAREINEHIPKYVAEKVAGFFDQNKLKYSNAPVFIIGFAFKGRPETSDVRYSPTLDLLAHLKKMGFKKIRGYDPVVSAAELRNLGVEACGLEEGFAGAHAAVVMNNHESYGDMDVYKNINAMKKPALFFDGWRIFPKEAVTRIPGVKYDGIGVE